MEQCHLAAFGILFSIYIVQAEYGLAGDVCLRSQKPPKYGNFFGPFKYIFV